MKIIIILFILLGPSSICLKLSKITPKFIKDSYYNIKPYLEEGKIAQKMEKIKYEDSFEKIKQKFPGIEQVLVDDQLRNSLRTALNQISQKKELDYERSINSSCFRAMLLMMLFSFNSDQQTMKETIKESDKSYQKQAQSFCQSSKDQQQRSLMSAEKELKRKLKSKKQSIYIIETVSSCNSSYEHYIICVRSKNSDNFFIFQSFISLYSIETSILNPKKFSAEELSGHLLNLSSLDELTKRNSLKEIFYYPNQFYTEEKIMNTLMEEFPSPVYFGLNKILFNTERKSPIKYKEVDEEAEINKEIFDLKP